MLPVGTYTASYGIEQYLNEGRIETADELGALIEGYLRRIIGPVDTVALGHAYQSAAEDSVDGILAADERFGAATLPAEFRESSQKAGGKLLELLEDTGEHPFSAVTVDGIIDSYRTAKEAGQTNGYYPVVLGLVCQQAGMDRLEAAIICSYSTVTGLLGAAQRLGRFGHTAIQAQLSTLFPVIEEICERYSDAELTAMCSFAPLADVRGMAHEHADRRLFMS